MLINPSDMRTLVIDFPSPLPFKKLGVLVLKVLYIESFEALEEVIDFLTDRDLSFASGLGGHPLLSPRGGWGNEFMLTLFRSCFPVLLIPPPSFDCGCEDVGAGLIERTLFVEGALRPLLGVLGICLVGFGLGRAPVLFRVLLTGNAGRAMLGGPLEARAGRGKAAAMVSCELVSGRNEGSQDRSWKPAPRFISALEKFGRPSTT